MFEQACVHDCIAYVPYSKSRVMCASAILIRSLSALHRAESLESSLGCSLIKSHSHCIAVAPFVLPGILRMILSVFYIKCCYNTALPSGMDTFACRHAMY